MSVRINKFSNLLMTKQVTEALQKEKALTPAAKKQIQELLYLLNEFGADKEYLGFNKFKKFSGGWNELRIKDGTNTWRILFRKLPESRMYGLVYLFLKRTDKITKAQWDKAEHFARLENWI